MTQLPLDTTNEYSQETREASPANFLLKIEKISSLSKYGFDKYESRAFEAGDYKWKLVIYPDGCGSENEGYVSVYFSIAETDSLPMGWEVNAIFTFFVHNQLLNNYLCFRGMTRRFNSVNPKWGFSKLMAKKELMEASKGFVVDDSCVFGAEVFVIKTQRIHECLSLTKANIHPYKREWKISDFSKLGHVWNSEEFQVGDHKWKVNLYPKGESSQAKDRYVSIFTECVDSKSFGPHQKVKTEVSLRIKNKLNGTDYTRKFNYWFTSSSPPWGYPCFISIDDINNEGYLNNDCCFLEIEICVQAVVLDAPKT